jgi:hypothetical protein
MNVSAPVARNECEMDGAACAVPITDKPASNNQRKIGVMDLTYQHALRVGKEFPWHLRLYTAF